MERLSVHERAFVRPSPSGGTLGGVAAETREAIWVVEAAGHDVVIVETVGVGQSEAAVAGMTDLFVLMQLPNAGDDLQAIKKGVLELADLVVVNKADLDPAAAARARSASSSRRCSSRHGARRRDGAPAGARHERDRSAAGARRLGQPPPPCAAERRASGAIARRRQTQARAWLWERIDAGLRRALPRRTPRCRALLAGELAAVDAGRLPVSVAARTLLRAFAGAPGADNSSN